MLSRVRRARAVVFTVITMPAFALAAAFVIDSGRRWH